MATDVIIQNNINKERLLQRSSEYLVFLSVLQKKSFNIKISKNIILPVVSYGCEIWSLTFREELRLRAFENRVLGIILRNKRGEWDKDLHI